MGADFAVEESQNFYQRNAARLWIPRLAFYRFPADAQKSLIAGLFSGGRCRD
jgi:hypothetical protein